jgi:hypothetical protein
VLARDETGTCFGIRNQFEVSGGGLESGLGTLLLGELDECAELIDEPDDPDAGVDAGLDAGIDAGLDAGVDAGLDAGEET